MKSNSHPEALDSGPVMANEYAVIKPSPIHGLGVFARVHITEGAHIMEYTGERISKAESLRRCVLGNHFVFALDEECDLDGGVPWNPARFINHSCAPNCETRLEGGRIWIVAKDPVPAGQEITFNYGYDLEDYRDHPCHCGAPHCAGYMVAEDYFACVRKATSP